MSILDTVINYSPIIWGTMIGLTIGGLLGGIVYNMQKNTIDVSFKVYFLLTTLGGILGIIIAAVDTFPLEIQTEHGFVFTKPLEFINGMIWAGTIACGSSFCLIILEAILYFKRY